MKTKKLPPVHPGVILRTELDAAGISANQAALAMRIPANRLTMILNGKRAITSETAMRLGRFFGTGPRLWLDLQVNYELQVAEDELADLITVEVQPMKLKKAS